MTILAKPIAGYHAVAFADRHTDPTSAPPSPGYVSLGSTGPEGITLTVTKEFQEVTGDALGDTIVDAVYRGGNCVLEFVLQELNLESVKDFMSATRTTAAPGATVPTHEEVGLVGHLASSFACCLQLTPALLTPAAAAYDTNTTRTFLGYPTGDFTEFLDTRHRVMPVRFQVLPFDNSGVQSWWLWGS